MLFKTITFASVVSLALAQASLPPCVLSCYTSSISASPGCSQSDFACLCGSSAFQAAVGQCLSTTCNSEAEIQAGEQFGVTTCKSVGITVAAPSIPLNNPSASGAAATGSSSGSSSAAPGSSSATSVASGSTTSTPVATSSSTVVSGTSSTSVASKVSSAVGTSSSAPTATAKSSATKTQVSGLLAVVAGILYVL